MDLEVFCHLFAESLKICQDGWGLWMDSYLLMWWWVQVRFHKPLKDIWVVPKLLLHYLVWVSGHCPSGRCTFGPAKGPGPSWPGFHLRIFLYLTLFPELWPVFHCLPLRKQHDTSTIMLHHLWDVIGKVVNAAWFPQGMAHGFSLVHRIVFFTLREWYKLLFLAKVKQHPCFCQKILPQSPGAAVMVGLLKISRISTQDLWNLERSSHSSELGFISCIFHFLLFILLSRPFLRDCSVLQLALKRLFLTSSIKNCTGHCTLWKLSGDFLCSVVLLEKDRN